MTLLRYVPVIFSSTLLALALAQVILAPGPAARLDGFADWLEAGEERVVELVLKPGDRYVVWLETSGLSDLYVMAGREAETYKASGLTPQSATAFNSLKKLTYAIPSQTGGLYLVLVKQLEAGDVKLGVEAGTVDDTTKALRSGREVLRNSFEAVVSPQSGFALPVYQFIPGTRLHLTAEGDGAVAVVESSDFLAYSRGRKQLSDLCKASNCIRGGGSLTMESEDFVDVYLVVEGGQSAGRLVVQVVATEKMLFYVGTCS
ncbi:MAG: hypothetical protein QXR20_03775 [Candidatus Caldarchaeum sp.]